MEILYIFLHTCAPYILGVNGDIQSDLSTLTFKNIENFEYLHSIVLRLQKEIFLYGETVSSTRLIFRYIKALSNSNKLRSFIAPKIIDFVTFLYRNIKLAIYEGVNIHVLYRFLEIIESPNILTTLGQRSGCFVPSYSTNNHT